jgi:hypothetical protein
MAAAEAGAQPRARRPTVTFLALAALVTLLAAVGWALLQVPAPLKVVRLPDGSVLRLEAVTFAPRHQLVRGRYWQRLLAPVLPARMQPTTITYRNPEAPRVVFWTSGLGARVLAQHQYRAVAFEQGAGEVDSLARPFNAPLPSGEFVRGWALSAYPRRRERLKLRIYEGVGRQPRGVVASFTVANPALGPFLRWQPAALPATETAGDLSVTLLDGRAGGPGPALLPERIRRQEWSQLTLRHRCDSRPPGQWEAVGLTLSDATGNRVVPPVLTRRHTDAETGLAWMRNLLPRGEVWKARVEYVQRGGFAAGDLWTVKGVPVPRRGPEFFPEQSTTHDSGPVAFRLVPRRDPSGELHFMLRLDALPRGVRLRLVHARDNRGRLTFPREEEAVVFPTASEAHEQHVTVSAPFGGNRSEKWWGGYRRVRVAPDARTVNLTFAVVRSRFVEFVFQPSQR